MDVDALISYVYTRTPIWDKRDKLHANRSVVDKLWKEIANEIQHEGKKHSFSSTCMLYFILFHVHSFYDMMCYCIRILLYIYKTVTNTNSRTIKSVKTMVFDLENISPSILASLVKK